MEQILNTLFAFIGITIALLIRYKLNDLSKATKQKIRRIAQNPVKLRGCFETWSAKSAKKPPFYVVKRAVESHTSDMAFEYENGEIVRDYSLVGIVPRKIRELDTEIISFKGDFAADSGTKLTVYTASDMEAYASDTIMSSIIGNRKYGKKEIDAEVWLNAENPKEYIVVSFLNSRALRLLHKTNNKTHTHNF